MTDTNAARREGARRKAERVAMRIGGGDSPDPADLAWIEDAARRLPRLQHEILFAGRVEGLSLAAIAEAFHLTIAQVKRHYAAGLLNFQRNLAMPRRQRWRRWFR